MLNARRPWFAPIAALLVAACSETSGPGAETADGGDTSVVEPDRTPDPGEPNGAGVGVPCHDDADCTAGGCIHFEEASQLEGVCSALCQDTAACPDGWQCEATGGIDGAHRRVPDVYGLDRDLDGAVDDGNPGGFFLFCSQACETRSQYCH